MPEHQITEIATAALEDLKGIEILYLDVRELTTVVDEMVIATGTSSRHVKALARNVIDEGKQAGIKPQSTEGELSSDWILIDYGDISVHVMLPETREFYDLERLWATSPDARTTDS